DPFRQAMSRLTAASLCHLPQALWSLRREPLSPKSAGMPVHFNLISNGQVAVPLMGQQYDPAALGYLLGGAVRTHPLLQQLLLLRCQPQIHRTAAHTVSKPHGTLAV